MKTAFSDFNVNIISATADTSLHDDIFDTVCAKAQRVSRVRLTNVFLRAYV